MTGPAKGRPALPPEEKRSRLMVFRVRADEERRVHAAAAKAGLKVGSWLRRVVLLAAGGRGGGKAGRE